MRGKLTFEFIYKLGIFIKFKRITSKMENSAAQLQCSIVTFGYEY